VRSVSNLTAPNGSLPSATPADQGVDARGISAFVDALEAHPGIQPHSLMLLRHGAVIAEGWWAPFGPDRVHLLYSLSKTFTVTALGFAIAEGLLGLDDFVVDAFPEFQAEITAPRSREIRVRHLAAMASGHSAEQMLVAFGTDPIEPVRGFLLNPPDQQPGTVFAYNQLCTYTIAAMIQRASGQTLIEYLRPRLFDPLGIDAASWQEYPVGRNLGFSGLHGTTRAIASLGQLYLQDGVWQGEQLLPAGWAEQVRTKHIENPNEPEPDWRQGYGYQVWIARHGYRGDGAFGQFCVILPEHDVVLAITSAEYDMQAVLDAAWTHLLPAFDGPVSPDDDAALAERMRGLVLPTPDATSTPDSSDGWATRFSAADAAAPLESVELGLRDGAWVAALEVGGRRMEVPIPGSSWAVVEPHDGLPPIGVAGGWTDSVTVVLELSFLETPHGLRVTVDRSVGTFTTAWGTEPLGFGIIGQSVFDLQAPSR
jgi:CubicO group peptidase (beta-lactamase class C family)